jgi:iron complex transport system ATP-binding protein
MIVGKARAATGELRANAVCVLLKGKQVLHDVTLALSGGGLIALVGPNGAGKSTLLKTLAGLVSPNQGKIELDGETLKSISPLQRARTIAYLPQSRVVHWPLPVRAIVSLGRLPYQATGINAAADQAAIAAAMATMDVTQFAARSVLDLSGGEQARVLMARALAQQAPILLADEPTAGLDPAHQLQLFEALQRTALAGATVVVATHDLSLAARFATTVVVMHEGRVAAVAPPEQAFSQTTLRDVYGITAKLVDINGVPVIVPIDVNT